MKWTSSRVGARVALAGAVGAVAVATVGLDATALANDIRGQLNVASDVSSVEPLPSEQVRLRLRFWEEWNGFLEQRTARLSIAREFAVVLTGSVAATGEQPPYRFHNGSLQPSTVVVKAGQAFQIQNDDACAYELFAEGLAEIGPLQTAPGNARPITVSAAGNWPLRDRNYAHVQGHLHALSDYVARATLESSGAFVFHGIEPGEYALHVFQGGREVVEARPVTVGDIREITVDAIAVAASR